MNTNYWENPKNPQNSTRLGEQSLGLSQFFTQIYSWMALGLALTGLISVWVSSTPSVWFKLVSTPFLFWGIVIAEFAVVVWFTRSAVRGAPFVNLATMFIIYAALNGVTLSVIFLAYTLESIAQSFFVTAASFGAMSVYGFVTKRDLSTMGRFFFMGLVGLILSSVINVFWQNSMLHMGIGLVGVLIFAGLTAYDTQALKVLYYQNMHDEAAMKRLSLQGALKLYLDFINLMLYLLRLMGKRR